jgi:hypothetical protein
MLSVQAFLVALGAFFVTDRSEQMIDQLESEGKNMTEEEQIALRKLDEVVNEIVAKAMASYDDNDEALIARVVESYDGNDVGELASLLDDEFRKDGRMLRFAQLWNMATKALND